jgi:hypothetical protein
MLNRIIVTAAASYTILLLWAKEKWGYSPCLKDPTVPLRHVDIVCRRSTSWVLSSVSFPEHSMHSHPQCGDTDQNIRAAGEQSCRVFTQET